MDVSDLVTEQKAKQAEFEVDDKSGIHVVAKAKGGKVLADLIVGKSTGPGTMVRLPGKDEVWQASGISRYLFDKAPADWRDKSITTFTPATPSGSRSPPRTAARPSLKKTGAKAGTEDKWDGRRVVGEDRQARQQRPERHRRRRCRAGRPTTSPTAPSRPTRAWTPPALTVTVGLKGGKKVTVLDRQQEGRGRVLRQDAGGAAGLHGQEVQRRSA